MAKNTIKRKFDFSDGTLFQICKKYIAIIQLFLADFVNLDSMYSAPFAANFTTQVDDTELIPDDAAVLGQQMGLTSAVNSAMTLCQDKVWELRRYVKKAFPNNKAKYKEFSMNEYDLIKDNQAQLRAFMMEAHTVATANSAALIAVNYSQARIDEIETFYDLLSGSDNQQEVKKGTRPVSTQTRVLALNSIYDKVSDLCEDGKYIYRNNPAMYNLFILEPSPGQIVRTGNVLAGITFNIIEKTFKADDEILLVNTGTVDLQFGLMKLVGDVVLVGAGVTVLAGTSQTVQASALGDVTQNHFLNVTNNSGADGSWSVTL